METEKIKKEVSNLREVEMMDYVMNS